MGQDSELQSECPTLDSTTRFSEDRSVFGIRKAIKRRLHNLIDGPPGVPSPLPAPVPELPPAPVMVYCEKDRNIRELTRIKEVLDARSIAYRILDVSDDLPMRASVAREVGCEEDDLPVVFIAGTPVGCYNELVQWDVSGRLVSAVRGQ